MAEGGGQRSGAGAAAALTAFALLLLAGGCDAMRHAEESAHEECAKQGKPAVILARQKHDDGLVSTAAVTVTCIDPQYVVYTTDAFGVQLYADPHVKGAMVVAITPGSIADKAYLKVEDVMYEFGGTSIGSAAELRSAVQAAPAGQQILIKFHRTQYERGAYAQC